MLKKVIFSAVLIFIVCCSGCSIFDSENGYIRDRTADYKPGESLPPIKTPPGVESIRSDPYYKVPELTSNKPVKVSIYPPTTQALKQENHKPIDNDDNEEKESK